MNEWVKAAPQLVRLLWRLARDDRVPKPVRVAVVGLAVYLVVPFDIVPDWVPFAGQLDDVLIGAIGIRQILRRVPPAILVDHWRGDRRTLERLLGRELTRTIDV